MISPILCFPHLEPIKSSHSMTGGFISNSPSNLYYNYWSILHNQALMIEISRLWLIHPLVHSWVSLKRPFASLTTIGGALKQLLHRITGSWTICKRSSKVTPDLSRINSCSTTYSAGTKRTMLNAECISAAYYLRT